MISDLFGTILQELGAIIKNPNLKPDEHNSCLLKFKGDLKVQIEPEKSGRYLVVGCDLGNIPAGRYRENIFNQALKANGMPIPRYGIFAYSKHSDHLVIFDNLPLKDLTGQKIADFLPSFLEKARTWKTAIEKGDVPVLENTYTSKPIGLFGLIR